MSYNAWCSCGWHGTYRTEGLAEFGRRKHRCERWEAKRAGARRHADRMRAVDRQPKPCTHPRANHQHGTNAAYRLDACRCWPCTTAASEYGAQLKRDRAYGNARMVDAELVRQHVQDLMAAGMGKRTICSLSGTSRSAMRWLLLGKQNPDGTRRPPSTQVSARTAAALLAVRSEPTLLAAGAVVDATGARRRIQALAAIGWPVLRVARQAGMHRQNLDKILQGGATTARTARTIAAVYEDLWDQAPEALTSHQRVAVNRTLRHAQAQGWAPPMAWDEDGIDDPEAVPDLGDRRRGVDLDDWLHLVRGGESPERAAERCGVKLTAVSRAAHRAGRHDLFLIAERAVGQKRRSA